MQQRGVPYHDWRFDGSEPVSPAVSAMATSTTWPTESTISKGFSERGRTYFVACLRQGLEHRLLAMLATQMDSLSALPRSMERYWKASCDRFRRFFYTVWSLRTLWTRSTALSVPHRATRVTLASKSQGRLQILVDCQGGARNWGR